MAGITLKSILELANSKDAKPSTLITFRLAGRQVSPEQVELAYSPYGGHRRTEPEIEVRISDEFIEQRVRERMKEMLAIQVDAMFRPEGF